MRTYTHDLGPIIIKATFKRTYFEITKLTSAIEQPRGRPLFVFCVAETKPLLLFDLKTVRQQDLIF